MSTPLERYLNDLESGNFVRDEAQAEDLAQETFLAALESPPRTTLTSHDETGGGPAAFNTAFRRPSRRDSSGGDGGSDRPFPGDPNPTASESAVTHHAT